MGIVLLCRVHPVISFGDSYRILHKIYMLGSIKNMNGFDNATLILQLLICFPDCHTQFIIQLPTCCEQVSPHAKVRVKLCQHNASIIYPRTRVLGSLWLLYLDAISVLSTLVPYPIHTCWTEGEKTLPRSPRNGSGGQLAGEYRTGLCGI